jgi:hypothetical protein
MKKIIQKYKQNKKDFKIIIAFETAVVIGSLINVA